MTTEDTIFTAGKNYLEDGVTLLLEWYLTHNTEQNLPEFYDGFGRLMKRFIDVTILDLMESEEVRERIKKKEKI